MKRWYDDRARAPLSIWGVGGVGKSALVARFLALLPNDTMLLWLDFDEAGLAPDDAASVIAALHEQVAAQLETDQVIAPRESPDPAEGSSATDAARTALVGMLEAQAGRRAMIVLDSFEAAQYSERYQELWPELEALTGRIDGVQVIVSGRAPVPTLYLHGERTIEIALAGLDPEDARAWLGRHGIPPGEVQDDVVRTAVGSPLVLKLAERLAEAGGKLDDLPKHLPEKMIAGVLYDRILDRVHNAEFKEVAKGAVVLRRLSAEMVAPIFDGLPLTLPATPAAAWFPEFAREAALVEGQEELRLRPEVRAAALSLLERQEPGLVREIDRRALAWYDGRDINDPAVAAERVYHLLRLDDGPGAIAAWRDGCGAYLQYAEETLHGASKEWLSRRLGTSTSVFGGDVGVWELEAADRISQSRAAGLPGHAKGIFSERKERGVGGALAFHEAYESWASGRQDAALGHLVQHGIEPGDHQSRERAMLAALIYAELGNGTAALRILSAWSDRHHWVDRRDGLVERAAVHAARVCLLAPLALEDALASQGGWPTWIIPMDVLREEAQVQTNVADSNATAYGIQLPLVESERDHFLANLEKFRRMSCTLEEPGFLQAERLAIWKGGMEPYVATSSQVPGMELLICSWQRWAVLGEGAMVEVLDQALGFSAINPLDQSVITVLGLFAGVPGLALRLRSRSLDLLLAYMRSRLSSGPSDMRSAPADPAAFGGGVEDALQVLRARALQWCGPELHPLRQLVQRFAGRLEEA